MSLATLYSEKRSALAPPAATPDTYEEAVFEMERNKMNSLVTRAEGDATFTPAPNQGTYEDTSFALERAGANRLVTRFATTPFRTPAVADSYLANLFANREISQL